jgi:hypothetical protein
MRQEQVRDQAGEHSDAQPQEEAELAGGGKRARSQ